MGDGYSWRSRNSNFGASSKGRTRDFESRYDGSNPSAPTLKTFVGEPELQRQYNKSLAGGARKPRDREENHYRYLPRFRIGAFREQRDHEAGE